MADINLENFLRDLETDYDNPNTPLDEVENQLQWNGGWGCASPPQDHEAMFGAVDDYSFLLDDTSFCVDDLLNTVTPPTATAPPPVAVTPDVPSPPAQQGKRARAAINKKKAKSKAAHTLSERKRRGRINENMRALQELIPNSNKLDKASMFDEAIEFVKSAKLLLKEGYLQQMPSYTLMAQAASLLGPMWNPQITPAMYPFHQVQLPNQDQQFYGVHQEQNPNP